LRPPITAQRPRERPKAIQTAAIKFITKVYRPKTPGIRLGFPDALLTKDGGVVFGANSDWADFSGGTHLTRFFAGKSYVKDGDLPFAPGADVTLTDLGPSGEGTVQLTASTFALPIAPLAVTLAPVTLKREDVPLTVTTFAP